MENIHRPCGFAYQVVTDHEEYKKPVQVYRGEDASEQVILRMHEEYEAASSLIHSNKPMNALTREELASWDSAQCCYMCQEAFATEGDKVFDHCHYRY